MEKTGKEELISFGLIEEYLKYLKVCKLEMHFMTSLGGNRIDSYNPA